MIYTELTALAMRIAYDAHHGQTDKAGAPYIFHPYHVAEQMTTEYSVCAALLHDTVEDTEITIEYLERFFPAEVTEAVRLLTHDKDVSYEEYISAIKANPIARAVKYADIKHNSDISRLDASGIPEEKKEYLKQKYTKALRLLSE